MSSWRLSRIEEELERLSHSSADDGITRGAAKDDGSSSNYSCTAAAAAAAAAGGHENALVSNEDAALRFIKEKYDSLGKVKVRKPSSAAGEEQRLGEAATAEGAPSKELSHHLSSAFAESTREEEEEQVMRTTEQHLHRSSSDVIRSTLITEQEVNQVEMFYRSHKTSVFVCPCQATLYLSDPKRNCLCPLSPLAAAQEGRSQQQQPPPPPPSAGGGGGWTVVRSGVPVLVLDSGETRQRQRRLHVVLAERGTGFCLWRDRIDCLTSYSASSSAAAFHTMHLSTDHSMTVGLRFDDPPSAARFVHQILHLTSNADDPLLSLASSSASASSTSASGRKIKTKVTKADISQPCCFTHITKLDPSEGSNLLRRNHTEHAARNSPVPGSRDRYKVKLKP